MHGPPGNFVGHQIFCFLVLVTLKDLVNLLPEHFVRQFELC